MKKFAFALVGVLLVGGGCSAPAPSTPTTPADQSTNTASNTEPTAAASEFTLTGEATAMPGEAKLQWSVPADFAGKHLRLLNTSVAGRDVAQGAYWQDVQGSAREYVWSALTSGKRFFRVCAVVNNACAQSSNEIELLVR